MQGEELAAYWRALFEEHATMMRGIAAHVIKGNSRDGEPTAAGVSADDIVQVVFIELINAGKPLQVDSVAAALATRTRQRAIDAVRRAGRGRELAEVVAAQAETGEGEVTPEEAALARVEAAVTAGAFDGLPQRERHAVNERVRHGRPSQEVADELGVTTQRVSQLVRQGLRRLQDDSTFVESVSFDNHDRVNRTGGET